jgi:diketogulonate reductase-like aldo/keto reductase
MRMVQLPDGTEIASLGQGTWHMAEGHRSPAEEAAALKLGLDLGMTLIDTAEMYADGGAEKVVGEAVAGQRDRAFIVSKVYPQNATRNGTKAACERSLKRLRTDHIDLYLLHWRGAAPLAETVEAFERLRAEGKIRHWGVSNLDTDDMAELPNGARGCATNQILYNLDHRGPEFDLLRWCADRAIPIMAYSPVGQGGRLLRNPALARIATRHNATPAQIALSWTLLRPDVISIPKAGDPTHLSQNAAAASLRLSGEDLAEIDAAFPPPRRRQSLAML